MSNLERDPAELAWPGTGPDATCPEYETIAAREVPLGGPRAMFVRRTLPHRDRSMVGAWCFVDHYGPHDVRGGASMQVPPHPHLGLQTVSWLLDGEILHRDSLGSVQLVRPGQLNLMTAGAGISHSEETPAGTTRAVIHGVQLWVAQPDASRWGAPAFAHHADLPVLDSDGVRTTVIVGEVEGARSPARTYSPLVGAEVSMAAGTRTSLRLDPAFEHAVVALSAPVQVDRRAVVPGDLLYLGWGRDRLELAAPGPGDMPDGQRATVLVLGGEPFDEELLMWWNFVGRDHDEIVEARAAWETGDRFGQVQGYPGEPLPAPAMPTTRLRPRRRPRRE